MAISPLNTSQIVPKANQPFDKRTLEKHPDKLAEFSKDAAVIANVSAKDQPQQLLFKTAIEKLNEKLEPFLGENAIQKGYESGIDISPEATAGRIVSMSTAFYDAFKNQHQGEDEHEVLESFMQTIGSGIEQGFAEAREILEGLQVLEGDIATNIDRTYVWSSKDWKVFDNHMIVMTRLVRNDIE